MTKDNKPKEKKYFEVRVTALLPATLTYRILAESAEQAAEMVKRVSPNSVKHSLIGKKDLKLMVYDAGSVILRFLKNF
jgi:hypothetical protein